MNLTGGNGPNEGNVVINGNVSLCDKGFDMEDAIVICRQLNMSHVSYMTRNSKFGNTSQTSGMSLSCFGPESSISECIRKENINCGESNLAGVACSNTPSGIRVKLE